MGSGFMIISIAVSLILLFWFGIPGLPSGGSGGIDTSGLGNLGGQDVNGDVERAMAEYEFNNACGNILLRGCTPDAFIPVHSQCRIVYGENKTAQDCEKICCSGPATAPAIPGGFPGSLPGFPSTT